MASLISSTTTSAAAAADDLAALPHWTGDELFDRDAAMYVRQPIFQPQLYHSTLFPAPHVIGIMGRVGSDKLPCIRSYLDGLNVAFPYQVLSVQYGRTRETVQFMQEMLEKRTDIVRATDEAACDAEGVDSAADRCTTAIIVEHADILFMEPDNEQTMLFIMQLRRAAAAAEAMIFLLLDRTMIMDDEAGGRAGANAMYRRKACEQMDTILYAGAPTPEFRSRLLDATLNSLLRCLSERAQLDFSICNALQDTDRVMLTDMTAGATPMQIRDFVRRVLRHVVSDDPPTACLDDCSPNIRRITLPLLEQFMFMASGQPSIIRHNGTREEDAFSQAAGKGLAAAASAAAAATKGHPPHGANGAQTDFIAEHSSLKAVRAKLNRDAEAAVDDDDDDAQKEESRKKKKKHKSKHSRDNVAPLAGWDAE